MQLVRVKGSSQQKLRASSSTFYTLRESYTIWIKLDYWGFFKMLFSCYAHKPHVHMSSDNSLLYGLQLIRLYALIYTVFMCSMFIFNWREALKQCTCKIIFYNNPFLSFPIHPVHLLEIFQDMIENSYLVPRQIIKE